MSKHAFERKYENVSYHVEAESLPSGSASFTFTPALPGRTSVILVEQGIIEDLVRCVATGADYDLEHDAIVLSLAMVDTVTPTPEQPDFKTAVELVPAEVFLDIVLDQIMTPCDCGDLNFGTDVPPPEGKEEVKKKTYLN